jgi:nucleoside 2-deoxyribosyltransferase
MILKTSERDFIRVKLKEKYEDKKEGHMANLKTNSTVANYDDLAGLINIDTGIEVTSSWLRSLFYEQNPKKSFQRTYLNACCHFIHGKKIDIEEFLKTGSEATNDYEGDFKIYWTRLEANTDDVIYYQDLRLVITTEESTLITENNERYAGSSPVKLRDKLFVQLSSRPKQEQVYIILHVGEAKRKNLEYIPGIIASGDSGNVHPCSSPILLVRDSVRSPDTFLLNAFFKDFAGNNLIRSWTISDVLKHKGLNNHETGKDDSHNARLKQKLALYFNKKFFLYFWSSNNSEDEPQLGRGTMNICNNEREVEIYGVSGTLFKGTVEIVTDDHIKIEVRSVKTMDKTLTIKLKIGPSEVHPYALGIYMTIGSQGTIESGTLVCELYKPEETGTNFGPKIFPYSEKRDEEVKHNIWQYFKDKGKNFIKVPSKGIFNDNHFDNWFNQQIMKSNRQHKPNKSNIFIAAPMSADEETFNSTREKIIELKEYLMEIYDTDVYFAGTEYKKEIGFTYAYTAAEVDLKKLNECGRFLLIHPAKVASSTLVELGWALAQGKSCVLFYKNRDDLPFLVKGIQSPNIRGIEYTDINQLLHKAKHLKDNLFP